MGRRAVTAVVALGALFSACSNNNAQSVTSPTRSGNLRIVSMGVSDAGQDALGDWQYKAEVQLGETGGVDVTVTNLQVQALFASNILATASVTPVLSIPANSHTFATLVFAGNTHVADLSALGANVTAQFKDANGNTGSASASFSGFGPTPWDY